VLNDCVAEGKIPLMDINPGTYRLILDRFPHANFIGVWPPSVCIQRDRLANRGSEDFKSMPGRIMSGFSNMMDDRFLKDPLMRCIYQTVIVNDDLAATTALMDKLI
jgi:guanylate kinase